MLVLVLLLVIAFLVSIILVGICSIILGKRADEIMKNNEDLCKIRAPYIPVCFNNIEDKNEKDKR